MHSFYPEGISAFSRGTLLNSAPPDTKQMKISTEKGSHRCDPFRVVRWAAKAFRGYRSALPTATGCDLYRDQGLGSGPASRPQLCHLKLAIFNLQSFGQFLNCHSRTFVLLLLPLLFCFPGCATYQFGNRSLFRDDLRTIYVPIARNDTFRHDLGVRLTEAVIRQIQLRTPYKVTGDPAADSTLTVRFTSETKRVLTETINDDPRALDALVTAQAIWVDRAGNSLMQNQLTVGGNLATQFLQSERFVPEAGQSIESTLQVAIDDLADRIVSQMENRW